MSFIYRNALIPSVGKWNAFSRIYGRFKKAWTSTDGIVYDKKLTFYHNTFLESDVLKRFLNVLGLSWEEFSNQKVDSEVESMWFYINPTFEWDGSFAGDIKSTSQTTQLVLPTAQEISDIFNDEFTGKTVTVTVEYGGSNMRYINDHELTWDINEAGVITTQALNTSVIRQKLESNPWYYFANSRHKPYIKDNIPFQHYDGATFDIPKNVQTLASSWLTGTTKVSVTVDGETLPNSKQYLGVFALMSEGSMFTKTGDVKDEIISTASNIKDGEVLSYKYSQDYTFNGAASNDVAIQSMIDWYDAKSVSLLSRRPIFSPIGIYKDDISLLTNDNLFKLGLESLQKYEDPDTGLLYDEVTNSLFQNGQLKVYEASRMRRRDFVLMLATCIKTDYKVEDAEWWEVIVAVILFVLAVVAFIYTGGGSLGLFYASTVLAVGSFVLGVFGGLSAQKLVKIIGAFAQITGYASMVLGFMTAVQNAGREAASKSILAETGKQATQSAIAQEMVSRTFLDNLGSYLSQSLTNVTSKLTQFVSGTFDDIVTSTVEGLKIINQGLEFYQDKEYEELQKEYEEAQEEQEKYDLERMDNMLKNPAEAWVLMEDRITSYDALSELNRVIESNIGKDKTYAMWDSNVNSV